MKKKSKSETAGPVEHSRDRLLKAAFEVFSQSGYHGTTTKNIALKAGVNEALIMRHFKSKEGLFMEVVASNVACESCDLPYPAQETVEKELLHFCNFLFERDRKKSDFFKIMIGHSLQDKAFVCKADEQLIDKRKPLLAPRLLPLQKKGLVRKDVNLADVEEVVMNQVFAATFFNSLIAIHSDKHTKQSLELAVKVIAAGLAK